MKILFGLVVVLLIATVMLFLEYRNAVRSPRLYRQVPTIDSSRRDGSGTNEHYFRRGGHDQLLHRLQSVQGEIDAAQSHDDYSAPESLLQSQSLAELSRRIDELTTEVRSAISRDRVTLERKSASTLFPEAELDVPDSLQRGYGDHSWAAAWDQAFLAGKPRFDAQRCRSLQPRWTGYNDTVPIHDFLDITYTRSV